jgi:hypothetical protein
LVYLLRFLVILIKATVKILMAKLTRYKSFSKLKLSGNSLNKTGSDHSIELSEFEEFINALRKASLNKSKVRKKKNIEWTKI